MKEEVILINEANEVIGQMEKMEAHQKGLLHRAFSVFLFNEKVNGCYKNVQAANIILRAYGQIPVADILVREKTLLALHSED